MGEQIGVQLHHFFQSLFFYPEDGGSRSLRNVVFYQTIRPHMVNTENLRFHMFVCREFITSVTVKKMASLLRNLKVPGLNLKPETHRQSFQDFPLFLQANARILPQM
jgi:hypothetical protein